MARLDTVAALKGEPRKTAEIRIRDPAHDPEQLRRVPHRRGIARRGFGEDRPGGEELFRYRHQRPLADLEQRSDGSPGTSEPAEPGGGGIAFGREPHRRGAAPTPATTTPSATTRTGSSTRSAGSTFGVCRPPLCFARHPFFWLTARYTLFTLSSTGRQVQVTKLSPAQGPDVFWEVDAGVPRRPEALRRLW